jgi:16S rRNA (cytosine1402-N4)-methyltransferase
MEQDNSVYHVPVMLKEVETYLINNLSGIYVDGTIGGGGHSRYLLEKYPNIKIVALDRDIDAISKSKKELEVFKERITFAKSNFKDFSTVLDSLQIRSISGILFDLGVSSHQIDDVERGFSFLSPCLDMRMDKEQNKSALDILKLCTQEELSDILYKYGEERFSRKISRRIKENISLINSAKDLADIVGGAKRREGKIHPATKVFQALRISVNDELLNITEALNKIPGYLEKGGRAVVLSYHSLEDRIVKNNFRDLYKAGVYNLLTKKIVIPDLEEVKQNPRSRSAKLRAAEKA